MNLKKSQLIWIFSFIVNIITLSWIFFKIQPNSKTIALHYNAITGVDWYGEGYNLYLIPFSGFVILFLNLFLYNKFKNNKTIYLQLFSLTSFCIQCILFLSILMLEKVKVS